VAETQAADGAEPRLCDCGFPERWARDPSVPIEFNPKVNEYYLVAGTKGGMHHVMHYCFWCGGRLPESKRGELFTEPAESEMAQVRAVSAEAKSAADVLRVLGEPDATFDWVDTDDPELNGAKKWDKCYRYSSRWKTLVVNVMEFSDGSIEWAVHGHFLGSSGAYCGADEPGHKPWWRFWG
jgi:hypothetical protein